MMQKILYLCCLSLSIQCLYGQLFVNGENKLCIKKDSISLALSIERESDSFNIQFSLLGTFLQKKRNILVNKDVFSNTNSTISYIDIDSTKNDNTCKIYIQYIKQYNGIIAVFENNRYRLSTSCYTKNCSCIISKEEIDLFGQNLVHLYTEGDFYTNQVLYLVPNRIYYVNQCFIGFPLGNTNKFFKIKYDKKYNGILIKIKQWSIVKQRKEWIKIKMTKQETCSSCLDVFFKNLIK